MFVLRLALMIVLVAWAYAPAAAADEPHPEAAHAEHGEHGGGLPGLDPLESAKGFRGDLMLWSFITFFIFLGILTRFAWVPLRDSLDTREAKIRQDIAAAESHRVKAEAMLRDYEAKLAKSQEEVKQILAEARRDADHAKQEILTTAEKESAAMRHRAVADIERARDQALGELFDFASKNVMQATEQVVGRSLTGSDQERLVREALAGLDLRKN